MAVYLLHFDRPHPRGRRPRHYLGWTDNLPQRLAEHRSGRSRARLMEVIADAGIGWTVARVWPSGDRRLERRLKNWKKARVLCPCCKLAQSAVLELEAVA